MTIAPAGADTEITVEQLQAKGPATGFAFPLDVDLVDATGKSERIAIDVAGKTTTKKVRAARPPVSVVVDADELMLGTLTCGQSGGLDCKTGFRCQGGTVSVCVPR